MLSQQGGAALYATLKESTKDEQRFQPFEHQDRYGAWGMQPQPAMERWRQTFMAVTLVPLKALVSIGGLIGVNLTCRLERWLPLPRCTR